VTLPRSETGVTGQSATSNGATSLVASASATLELGSAERQVSPVACRLAEPPPATALLPAADTVDDLVRTMLARKIAVALPGLSGLEQVERRERTCKVLAMLVSDETVRVRALIAHAIAELPDIPRDVALALARDTAICVSDPILRLSPLLSAGDLLGLLQAPPHAATARAIASRTGLPEAVADYIAASADSDAIRALLSNHSVAIRESTLDALIARAGGEPNWHAPLVHRPSLSARAAEALSLIVADHLLVVLASRADIAAPALAAIKRQIKRTLVKLPGLSGITDEELMAAARGVKARGRLTEAKLQSVLRSGDTRQCSALLAVAAGVTLAVVDRASSLRSAKALLSLVQRAGFSMQTAGAVQALLGSIAPGAVLSGGSGYPLSAEEVTWQMDFLGCKPL
jgi:uncharacterized protein (DUF2336 family)